MISHEENMADNNFPYFSLTEEPQVDRKQDMVVQGVQGVLGGFADFGGNLKKSGGDSKVLVEDYEALSDERKGKPPSNDEDEDEDDEMLF